MEIQVWQTSTFTCFDRDGDDQVIAKTFISCCTLESLKSTAQEIMIMMVMKLPILACAEKLETEFSLPHEKPRTKTDKHSTNGKRTH